MWICQICRFRVSLTLDDFGDFARFGESAGLVFGPGEFAVDDDVENAFAFSKQHGVNSKAFLQLGSQTDRLGFVVSLCAVVNFNFHHRLLYKLSFSHIATSHKSAPDTIPMTWPRLADPSFRPVSRDASGSVP